MNRSGAFLLACLLASACSGNTATPLAEAPPDPHIGASASSLPAYPGFRPLAAEPVMSSTDAPSPGVHIIDADTVDYDGTRYRLHGIDAPESSQTCRTWGLTWNCGTAATQALAAHATALSCIGTDTDRYGRTIGTCAAGGVDLNAWLVESGWALAYRQFADDYVPQEEGAHRQHAGIHSGEFINPWDWRRGHRLPGHDTFAALTSRPIDIHALAHRLLHGDHTGVYGYWLRNSVFGLADTSTLFSMGAFHPANPTASGPVTYRGHLLAIDRLTSETLIGSATLIIPDLADPSVTVTLTNITDPDDHARSDISWHVVPLRDGHFEASTPATRIAGRLYGPDHQEAGGLVATDTLEGAFGAYRD